MRVDYRQAVDALRTRQNAPHGGDRRMTEVPKLVVSHAAHISAWEQKESDGVGELTTLQLKKHIKH